MSRLIAVPVGQGDAFYFESEGWSVLVDGGRSQSGLAPSFQRATGADRVGVTVCTHNDADHANGILGFLEAGVSCGEVWLPGRWLSALPSVLRPFVEVFVELVDNVAQVTESAGGEQQRGSGVLSIEAYAEQLRERSDEVRTNAEGPPVGEDGWPEEYVPLLEQAEPWEVWSTHWARPFEDGPWSAFPYRYYRYLGQRGAQLLWSAIEAASRIRAIALEAFHHGVPVRWFEYDATAASGGASALLPLNARAVVRVRPLVGRLLAWLALTVSNKESLVFWCPPRNKHPGVLFTADSDLAGITLPPGFDDAVATAPHHGSEANARAYSAVAAVASSVTWVRSDGRYRNRPGPTFLGLSARRFCTLCRLSGGRSSRKQAVHLVPQGGVWTPQRTRPCRCR